MQHLDEGTIHSWLDGALGAVQARDAELHVATCRECAERVAEARGLIAASSRILMALDHVPADVVPAAARQVAVAAAVPMPMVAAAAPRAETPARRSWWGHRYARVAAVIALVAAGTLVVARESGRDAAVPPVSQRAHVSDSMAVAAAPPAPAAVPNHPPVALGGAARRESSAPAAAAKSAAAPRRDTGAPPSAGSAGGSVGGSAFGTERAKTDAMSSALQASRANAPRALAVKASAESNQVVASPPPRLVATDTVQRGGTVVRRETYEVDNQHVVLEAQLPPGTPNEQARGVPAPAPAAPAAADSASMNANMSPVVIRVIRWRGTDGVDYTLSGPLSADALQRIRVALGKG
jgi:hypothetical protein